MRNDPGLFELRLSIVKSIAPRLSLVIALMLIHGVAARADVLQQYEDFLADPGWDGVNNLPGAAVGVVKTQEFGYSRTNFAGGDTGEIGGQVFRSLTPASYAKVLTPKGLNDPLSASGKLAVTQSSGGSGVLVGWFNSASRGWRTPNSLVFRIDGESDTYRIFFEYGTQMWNTGGGQTFEGPYQTTTTPMLKADGAPHAWSLEYDPDGAEGAGQITFTLDGNTYTAALSLGHKAQGAVFDRFGILNQQIAGDGLTLYLDALVIGGVPERFDADPGWEGVGNRVTFEDRAIRPIHDFGYRPSSYAGGEPGEMGGLMWRIESTHPEQACYYGAAVGHLTLDDALKASGKASLTAAAADSAVLLGWFNSCTYIGTPPDNFLGILVEGPSRAGHYFRPAYGNSEGVTAVQAEGPAIRPDGKVHEWTLRYVPGASGTGGRITVTLDGQPVTLDVPPEARKGNATFDRFGAVSWHRGGHFVEIYFDNLSYTTEKRAGAHQ